MTVSKFAVSPNKEVFLRIVLEYADVIEKCGEHGCSEFLLTEISDFLLVNKKYLADGPFLKALINKYRKLTLINETYKKYYDELFSISTDADVYDFTDIRTCIQSELNSIVDENSVAESTEKDAKPFHKCEVLENGTKRYLNEKGQYHHTYGPAIEFASGDTTERLWYLNGKLHRTDGPAVEKVSGHQSWYQHGKLHRTVGPAIEWPKEGIKEWYFEGKKVEPMFHECKDENGMKKYYNEKGDLHRTHGPSVERADGYKAWYLNGKLHRTDGPAIVYSGGAQEWYQNNKPHRTGGPAIIRSNGDQEWYQNGERHREGGPAIENVNGYQAWWQNGKRHRTDGPAVERVNGTKEWYFEGKNVEPMFHE